MVGDNRKKRSEQEQKLSFFLYICIYKFSFSPWHFFTTFNNRFLKRNSKRINSWTIFPTYPMTESRMCYCFFFYYSFFSFFIRIFLSNIIFKILFYCFYWIINNFFIKFSSWVNASIIFKGMSFSPSLFSLLVKG